MKRPKNSKRNDDTNNLLWWNLEGRRTLGFDFVMDQENESIPMSILVFLKQSIETWKEGWDPSGIMDHASSEGRIDVLEWFQNIRLVMDTAYRQGYIDVKQNPWFKNGHYDLSYSKDALIFASARGLERVLEWWKKSPLFENFGMDWASANGYIFILDKWKNRAASGLECRYSERAMDDASMAGRFDVLEWWKNSGLECRYSERTMDDASAMGRIDVLEWWISSNLECRWSECAMDDASKCRIDVLDWWKDSDLECRYSENAMDNASWTGCIDILDWWKNSGLACRYSERAMDNASAAGRIDVLDWWIKSGLDCRYSERAMDAASSQGRIDILDWWKQCGLKCRYSERAMDDASLYKHTNVLDWWKQSGLELRYSVKALDDARVYIKVLNWWKSSGLELRYTKQTIARMLRQSYFSRNGHTSDTCEWWYKNGDFGTCLTSDKLFQGGLAAPLTPPCFVPEM